MRHLQARTGLVIALALLFAAAAAVAVARFDPRDDATTGPTASTSPGTAVPTSSHPATTPSTEWPAPTTSPQQSTTTTAAAGEEVMVVRRGHPSRPVVALTFDAGSDTGHAAEILDTLAANHVSATFGMTGRWADANPVLVRRMVADGHQLVNHSYDHPSFTGRSTGDPPLSRSERLDQLARADAAIGAATGTTTVPWFRPPYGDEDASVRADVAAAGYRYELLWTVDSLGWRGLAPDSVVQRCVDAAVPGAIYLFHVGAASTDHLALQQIIDGLSVRGFSFVTATGLVDA